MGLVGCAQVLGLGDFKDGAAGGAGGSGGAGGQTSTTSSGNPTSGSGSTGTGATTCTPSMSEPCYDGPIGTENVGVCHAGTHTCNPDGMGYGTCLLEKTPSPEDCSKPGDEDCNGFACGDTTWAFGAGDSAFANGYAITQDPMGNTYAVGDFPSSLVLGATTLDSAGQYDVFVVKVDPMGTVLWAKRFGSSGADAVLDVAATATHVYVLTGSPTDFGSGLGAGVTLAKLDWRQRRRGMELQLQ